MRNMFPSRADRTFVLVCAGIVLLFLGGMIRFVAKPLSSDIRGPYSERTYSAPLVAAFDPQRHQLLLEAAWGLSLLGGGTLLLAAHHWVTLASGPAER